MPKSATAQGDTPCTISPPPSLLLVSEASKLLRVTPHTVRTMIEEGSLRAIRVRRQYRVFKDDVDRKLKELVAPPARAVAK
jgi:excisionase family DNA binding protein